MICKDFESKMYSGRLIARREIYGLGILFDCCCPFVMREVKWQLRIDFICVRFWLTRYLKTWEKQ